MRGSKYFKVNGSFSDPHKRRTAPATRRSLLGPTNLTKSLVSLFKPCARLLKPLSGDFGDHVSGNASLSERCVTMHLYSSPYLECCFMERHGADCKCTEQERRKYLPLIHCNDCEHYYPASEELETLALFKSRPVYGNLRKIVQLLRKEIVVEPSGKHAPENIQHIIDILSCFALNPK